MSLLHKDCLSNIGQNKHFDSPKLNISMESLPRTRFFATVSVELEDDTVREVSNNFWFIFTASWSFYALYSKTQFLWYGALCSLNIGRRFTWSFSDFFSSVWQPIFPKKTLQFFQSLVAAEIAKDDSHPYLFHTRPRLWHPKGKIND